MMLYSSLNQSSPGSASNTARALATPPCDWSTGVMTTRNLTRGMPAKPKHTYIETQCWTCQRPLMRQARKEQHRHHYCSMPCWQRADAVRRLARLWSQVMQEGECWLWQGSADDHGYGHISVGRKARFLTHRFVYIWTRGAIPDDLVIDHLCRRPPCLNPAHLEPVPQRVNTFRGLSPIATNRHKTHCPYGHPYAPENTIMLRVGGRQCRQCKYAANRNYQAKRRARSKTSEEVSHATEHASP